MSNVATQVIIDGKNNTRGAFADLNRQIDQTNQRLAVAGKAFKAAFSVAAVAAASRSYSTLADQSTQMESRLKLASRSQEEFNRALGDVRRIANENGASITSVTQLYARLTPALREAGRSQTDVARVTEAVTKAMRISGASASESAAGIQQFAQALGSAVLRGDEFNSIAEAAPRLMQALADGMGVPVGKLREMAAAGKLTAEVVTNALLSQLPKLTAEAEAMGETFGSAGQRLENAAIDMAGAFDKMTGASSLATKAMNDLAQAMNKVSSGEFLDSFRDEKQTVGGINTEISVLLAKLRDLNDQRGNLKRGNWFERMAMSMRGVTEESIRAEEMDTKRRIQALRDRLKAMTGVNEEVSAEEQAHNDKVGQIKEQRLEALKANLAAEEKAQEAANKKMAGLKAERLRIEKEFTESISKTQAGANGEPTFNGVMDLKAGAREALLGDKDGERAVEQAREALSVLEQLESAGVNTYGFKGIKEELKAIALAGNDLQQQQAQQQIDQIGTSVDTLKQKIEDVPKVKVGFEYSAEDVQELTKLVDQMAEGFRQKLTIPLKITAGGAPVIDTDVPEVPKFAAGGMIRGPGSGTSDSIPAYLSNGEYVIRAAAVRKWGSSALDLINRGIAIPRFADGGLVEAAASVPGGSLRDQLKDWGFATLGSGSDRAEVIMQQKAFDSVRKAATKFGRTHLRG
ncbi:tape measure protein [Stutzerimonas urumqiensis]|uniref:tape measure protein n=1 Tax=Stutzerimonas urumqiensis TaxID=638269 RepID=UPI000EB1060E|nr:tape measure protein [Stutzerimonas urumqiensis]